VGEISGRSIRGYRTSWLPLSPVQLTQRPPIHHSPIHNTPQPMQTLSVPSSTQPSTSTLPRAISPFTSPVNLNRVVTIRSPPSLSITSVINRLALCTSNSAFNCNQQSSTVINRAPNQLSSVNQPPFGIGQQQVAHQLLNQPSAFVQQLTASVMQQAPIQLPGVSQH